MSRTTVNVEDLAAEIAKRLEQYTTDVEKGLQKAVDKVAKETNEEIKSHATFKGTGKYVDAFSLKKEVEGHAYKKIWHVKSPHYRIAHLLEKGHAKRNGGRTRAYPHIKYGEALAKKRLEELAKEVIRDAGN